MIGNPGARPLDAGQSRPPPGRGRPIAESPPALWQPVRGMMTDIDDTLTAAGQLEPAARQALEALQQAGVAVVAITGRPMGWSEPFVRPGPQAWPLQAIVAENGAIALLREGSSMHIEYAQDAAARDHNSRRLAQVMQRIVAEVPSARAARDSAGRVTDIAIDHAEHAQLDAASIARVVDLMRAEGMSATVSSIHVNGWFGSHDKLSGARWMVRRLFGRDLDAELERWVYVGDSTNDQLLFGHFPLSVGVANLARFAAELHTWPAWITQGERGAGFAEVAQRVLAAR